MGVTKWENAKPDRSFNNFKQMEELPEGCKKQRKCRYSQRSPDGCGVSSVCGCNSKRNNRALGLSKAHLTILWVPVYSGYEGNEHAD